MNSFKMVLIKKGIISIIGLGVFLMFLSTFGGGKHTTTTKDSLAPAASFSDDTDIAATAKELYSSMEENHQQILRDQRKVDEHSAQIRADVEKQKEAVKSANEANKAEYERAKAASYENEAYVKSHANTLSPEVEHGRELMNK